MSFLVKPSYGDPTAVALSPFHLWGTATVLSVKATPGTLAALVATNANAAVRYLQLHDKTSVPVTNDVPVISIPISAGTATAPGILNLANFIPMTGIAFATGIALGISTAVGTYQAATNADHSLNGFYV